MSMFPAITTADYLLHVQKQFDVKSAVAQTSPGHYSKGYHWSFWIEDDPRQPDGMLPLAKYRCYESGGLDSKWELVE